jgi:hypothetical protein
MARRAASGAEAMWGPIDIRSGVDFAEVVAAMKGYKTDGMQRGASPIRPKRQPATGTSSTACSTALEVAPGRRFRVLR